MRVLTAAQSAYFIDDSLRIALDHEAPAFDAGLLQQTYRSERRMLRSSHR